MMKNKIIFSILLLALIAAGIRIYYINNVKYHIPDREFYNIGDKAENDGLQFMLSDYKVCGGSDFDRVYNGGDSSADEYDILLTLTVKNLSDEMKSFNAAATGMMYGNKPGGNVNPYIFPYLNPGCSEILNLAVNEEKTVQLAFPYESENIAEDTRLIISLYPKNISFLLK